MQLSLTLVYTFLNKELKRCLFLRLFVGVCLGFYGPVKTIKVTSSLLRLFLGRLRPQRLTGTKCTYLMNMITNRLTVTNQKTAWLNEPPHDKTNNVAMRPAKTLISLGIRPVRSESSLSAWRKVGFLTTHWMHSEGSDKTGRMPIWVFLVRIATLLAHLSR